MLGHQRPPSCSCVKRHIKRQQPTKRSCLKIYQASSPDQHSIFTSFFSRFRKSIISHATCNILLSTQSTSKRKTNKLFTTLASRDSGCRKKQAVYLAFSYPKIQASKMWQRKHFPENISRSFVLVFKKTKVQLRSSVKRVNKQRAVIIHNSHSAMTATEMR